MADTWTLVSGYTASDYADDMVWEVDTGTKKLVQISGQALVAGEENSQYIVFKMDRYWDGIDISSKTIQIMYELNSTYFGTSSAVTAEITDDSLRFGWIVPAEACCVTGTLLFVIVITDTDYTLKTQIAETTVFKTISEDDVPEPTSETWYEEFQTRVDAALDNAENALSQAQSVLAQAQMHEETVTGSVLSLDGEANVRHMCEDAIENLVFMPCESGECEIIFFTGDEEPVVAITGPTIFPVGFTSFEANKIYRVKILNGIYVTIDIWPN